MPSGRPASRRKTSCAVVSSGREGCQLVWHSPVSNVSATQQRERRIRFRLVRTVGIAQQAVYTSLIFRYTKRRFVKERN